MSGCEIIEVINGRLKGVVDPRHTVIAADLIELMDVVDDITVRRGTELIHTIRARAAEEILAKSGWVQWEIDHFVWLKPKGRFA